MKKFREFLNEQNNKQLNEASLSRVYQHFNSDRPIGIITAFRGDIPYDENVKNNKKLAKDVVDAGFGFIWVDGAFLENEGTPEEKEVKEVSLFITGKEGDPDNVNNSLNSFLMKAAKDYNQDAYVFKPSNSKDVMLLDKQGKTLEKFKNAKFDKVAMFYTKLRNGNHVGKTFYLEERQRDTLSSKLKEYYSK